MNTLWLKFITVLCAAWLAALAPAASAQTYRISTYAGGPGEGFAGDGGPAAQARFRLPAGIALDGVGTLYIADKYNHRIRYIGDDGAIGTLAGNGKEVSSGDGGAAQNAGISAPVGVVIDHEGNLYIVESGSHQVRKITPAGVISTVAGNGAAGSTGDRGPATAARLKQPAGITVDGYGNLYIADRGNHRIRKVDSNGIITTFAGGAAGYSGDGGLATAAKLNAPADVAIDIAGNVYIADSANHVVRKVDSNGIITTLAGSGKPGFSGDGGIPSAARLNSPQGVAVNEAGTVYIADSYNHRIREIGSDGKIYTIAGSGGVELANGGFGGDQDWAVNARLFYPLDLEIDGAGNLYVADTTNQRIRRISPEDNPQAARIETVAGSGGTGARAGGSGGDGGAATAARLNTAGGVALDKDGILYIADSGNHAVRRVGRDGVIQAFAGTGKAGYSGDGAAASAAALRKPAAVAIDASGAAYIADTGNHAIRKVDSLGVISTLAGNGSAGYSGDGGPAKDAQVSSPEGLALDSFGNIYVADSGNHCIRLINPGGYIGALAGQCGKAGISGDGEQASAARLNSPRGLIVDQQGDVYVADRGNHRVRKIDLNGVITTVAGIGRAMPSPDGIQASVAALHTPSGVATDGLGNVYIAEYYGERIRKVDRQGIISSVAGSGAAGFGGDGGLAAAAQLAGPSGMAIAGFGSLLYIADSHNHRIRLVKTPSWKLSVNVQGAGAVVLASGRECDKSCEEIYPVGSLAELRAKPLPGVQLAGWGGDCADGQVLMNADRSCTVKFSGEPVATPPPVPVVPAAPTPPPAAEVTFATHPGPACGGTVWQTVIVDLNAKHQGSSLLNLMQAIPAVKTPGWKLSQDSETHLARLSGTPRSLLPVGGIMEDKAAGLRVDSWHNTWFMTGKGVTIRARPAVENICELQAALARFGLTTLEVQENGNLNLPVSKTTWISARPDWTSTQESKMPPGLWLLPAPKQPAALLAQWVYQAANGKKYSQWLYPAPPNPDSLPEDQASLGEAGEITLHVDGKTYRGILHYVVNQTQNPNSKLRVAAAEGNKGWVIYYPGGEAQMLFGLE